MCSVLLSFVLIVSFANNLAFGRSEEETTDSSTELVDSPFCRSESFVQYEILVNGSRRIGNNTWNVTGKGETATPFKPCLQRNGLPLFRKCLNGTKSSRSPRWEIVKRKRIECIAKPNQKLITNQLLELSESLSNESTTTAFVASKLKRILEEPQKHLIPADVHYSSVVLRNICKSKNVDILPDVFGVVDIFMVSDREIIRAAGNTLNSSNILLNSFETYLDSISQLRFTPSTASAAFDRFGVHSIISENLGVFFINPSVADVTGVAFYDDGDDADGRGHLVNLHYRFLTQNESEINLLNQPGIIVASFIPQSVWKNITDYFSSMRDNQQPQIVIKIYNSDILFADHRPVLNRKPSSRIISITIPDYDGGFSEPLPLLFRSGSLLSAKVRHDSSTGCGYWNYDTWVNDGISTTRTHGHQHLSNIYLCTSSHLTQFTFLVGGVYKQSDPLGKVYLTSVHRRAINVITIFGCTLSMAGLCGIFLTAVAFESWRKLASTKVLLHICTAMSLQMILFCFVDTNDMIQYIVDAQLYVYCVALGATLHYSVLVMFAWMLIIAVLQFQRYVIVLGCDRPRHFLLKSAMAAWGLPLIPILIAALVDPRTYIPNNRQIENDAAICYPSGKVLHFGVILPISIIISVNMVFFFRVVYNITHGLRRDVQRTERKMIVEQIRLSVLLIFLFGFTWIFGIFAAMKMGIIFSYLFCLTATLQGFVMFVYFVLLDPTIRNLWLKCFHCTKSYDVDSRERQSITAATFSSKVSR